MMEIIDNKVRTIIQDIYHQVLNNDNSFCMTEREVKYVVRLLLLDPNLRNPSQNVERKRYMSLGQVAAEQITNDPYHFHMTTVKMKILWDTTEKDLMSIVKNQHDHMASRVDPLLQEFMEPFKHINELPGDIYRRLVVTTVILSGLGNPANVGVYREAKAALLSVLKPSELETFASLSRQDKWARILELTQLVTGIRIFNEKRGLGGEGMPALTEVLQQAIDATIRTLETAFDKTDQRRLLLERAIQLAERPNDSLVKDEMPPTESVKSPLFDREEEFDNEEEELKNAKAWKEHDDLIDERKRYFALTNMTKEEVSLRKDVLSTTWNIHYYLNQILTLMKSQRFQVNLFLERLNVLLSDLTNLTQFRTAIPTDQIYPIFFDIAHMWMNLQDEMLLINVKANYSRQLITLYQPLEKFSDELEKILGPAPNSEKNRLNNEINKPDAVLHLVLPEDVKYIVHADQDVKALKFSFNGFCPIALVLGNGLLRRGLPELGYCQWLDRLYNCSTRRALARFCREPDRYVAMVLNLARSRTDLVELLQIEDDLVAVQDIYCLVPDRPERLPTSHVGVQTELHPVPSRIDVNYTWNQWDLLRRCIKLTDIVERRTHSTQTKWSQFRRDVNLLMKPPSDKEIQTIKNNSTNTAKPSTWIWGLRGFKTRDQHNLSMSRFIDNETCIFCKNIGCVETEYHPFVKLKKFDVLHHHCFLDGIIEPSTWSKLDSFLDKMKKENSKRRSKKSKNHDSGGDCKLII